ncbi:hypothetical protein JTZ10_15710 [Gordonia rubripertincta]|uniref:NTP pyrophosphohydrolase n=1 Tax=Gordonia rubripertincta TaxID=36822 RepID=A0AAW4G7C6_GORRU|nr:hypothetical protein [Gordonia rubripertincta]MBM7279198.1 hypothetical protein [Gordonia rubripertincta]QMU19991.1 hypothetical protein H3V45_18350 [Gordonia rubripertincta]
MNDPAPSRLDVPLLVVDGANVVGSVPDGWWRDRKGAAQRLRDRLARLAEPGLDALTGPIEVVLVVEGRARGIAPVPDVTVVEAPASGDDTIVDVVGDHPDRRRVVVTADRELRARVSALGAEILGPSSILS